MLGAFQNAPANKVDPQGLEFVDFGSYTVFYLIGAYGNTYDDFSCLVCCRCVGGDAGPEWRLALANWDLYVWSFVAEYYIRGQSGGITPRFSDDFIEKTEEHEAVHRALWEDWYHEWQEKLEARLRAEGSFSASDSYVTRAASMSEYGYSRYQDFWVAQANHHNDVWPGGFTPLPPEFSDPDEWWQGETPLSAHAWLEDNWRPPGFEGASFPAEVFDGTWSCPVPVVLPE